MGSQSHAGNEPLRGAYPAVLLPPDGGLHAPASGITSSHDLGLLSSLGETDRGHRTVNALVLTRANAVRLVPDPYVISAPGHPLVELRPGWPVELVGIASIPLEVLEGAPLLDDQPGPEDVPEEARLWVAFQLLYHLRHGANER